MEAGMGIIIPYSRDVSLYDLMEKDFQLERCGSLRNETVDGNNLRHRGCLCHYRNNGDYKVSKLEKTVIGLVCLCMMMMAIKACQPDHDEEEIAPVPPVSLRDEPQEQPMGNSGYTVAPQSSGGIDAGDVALGIIAGQALRGNPTTPTYIPPAPTYRSPMPNPVPVRKAAPTPQPKVRSHFVNPSKSSFGRSSFGRGSKR